MKIQYAWLVVAVIFAGMGVFDLAAGNMGGLLTLAIAGLIGFTGVHNMGGIESLMWDLKKRLRLLGKR